MADKKIVIQAEIKSSGVGQLSKEVDGVTQSTQGMKAGFDGATLAADGTAGGVKGINAALKAAGIGLVLAAIALSVQAVMGAWNMMTEALMRNKTVSEAYEKIAKGLEIVVDQITGAIVDMYVSFFTEADKFPGYAKGLELMFKNLGDVAQAISTGIEGMVNAFTLLKTIFTQLTTLNFNFDELATSASNFFTSITEQATNFATIGGNLKEGIKNYPAMFQDASKGLGELAENIQGIVEDTDLMKTKTEEQIKAEIEERKRLAEVLKAERELRKQSEKEMFDLFFKLRHENKLNEIELEDGKRQRALSTATFEMNQQKRAIENSLVSQKKKDQLLLQLEEKFQNDINAINATFDLAEETRAANEAQKLLDVQNETTLMLIESLEERALKELEIQKAKELASVESMDNAEEMKAAIIEKYQAKEAEVIKKNLDKKLKWEDMTQKQKLGLAAKGAGDMAKILGEETAAGKAMAVTQATIQTFLGAQSAFTSMSAIPVVGPALGAIAAAAAVASGIANVKSILSADSGGNVAASGGGGGGGATMSGPAPQMMSGAFELGAMEEPEPVKAFVVTDEMTNSQDQLANIRRKSTI